MKLTPNVTNFPRIVRCTQLINKIEFVANSRVNYYFDYNQGLNNCTITGIRVETSNFAGSNGTVNFPVVVGNFPLVDNSGLINASILITLVDNDGNNIIDDMPLISLGLGAALVVNTSDGYNNIRRFNLKNIDWSRSFVRIANVTIFGSVNFSIILSVYYVNNTPK